MDRTIRSREAALAWQADHEHLAPSPGDLAPDCELNDVAGSNPYVCRAFAVYDRPVALVFGSFT